MASQYPTGLDTIRTDIQPGTSQKGVHASLHNLTSDAVNKIEAELGVNPKGTYANVVSRLDGTVSPTLRERAVGLVSRAFPPNALDQLTNGVVTGGNYSTRCVVIQSCQQIELAFGNWYNHNGIETDGANDITVRAAIRLSGGFTVAIPLYFRGARDVVIKPGGTVWCDPIGFEPRFGDTFDVRTYVTVTAGQTWPKGLKTEASSGAFGQESAAETDLTTSGSPANSATYVYAPYAMRGTPDKFGIPVIAGIGDSVMAGYGNSTNPNGGYLAKALNNSYAWIQHSFPSANSGQWATYPFLSASSNQATKRKAIMDGVTHAVCSLGRNDTPSAPLDITTMQNKAITIWKYLSARNITVYQGTVTPWTTSTDAWATVGNQTVQDVLKEANRVAYNNWLRDGAPILNGVAVAVGSNVAGTLRAGAIGHPLRGYIEIADTVESARDSGKWKAGSLTNDGIHPNDAGDNLAKLAINPVALFGPAATA